jgi:hypothetical protein
VLSYVLPLRAAEPRRELTQYLQWLSSRADVIVVDGSAPDVFAVHAGWWRPLVRHLPVDPAFRSPMGKVGGVLTGVVRAHEDKVVIADDDVRYDDTSLTRLERLLDEAEVVRPQNAFTTWPWHAWWDTGRTLIARATGGDWPGTLGVRRDVFLGAGGYAGDVMFENLELVRTVRAAGGREHVALDVVVGRIPPSGRHFRSQRVRQAYDELARPSRLVAALAILPVVVVGRVRAALAIGAAGLLVAEVGRRRAGGRRHYPAWTTLAAPLWLAERAITSWCALARRICFGGVTYGDVVLVRAASSKRELRQASVVAAPRTRDTALGVLP